MDIFDTSGMLYEPDGTVISVSDKNYFKAALKGSQFLTEPFMSKIIGTFILTFAVPVYDNNRVVVGVLVASIPAQWLSEQIKDIVVGKTEYCFVLVQTGNAIAHKNFDFVTKQFNGMETGKTDKTFASVANLHSTAINSQKSSIVFYTYSIVFYTYKETTSLASYAKMKVTGWTVIISAPINECMDTVNTLRITMMSIGVIILVIVLIIVYFVARAIVQPIQTAVSALQSITQGDGDLTVRLPVHGNDEITDMSEYFNETIAKIGKSIRVVSANSSTMKEIGNELASNMTETASAVQQIRANIDGVKQQALTQAASVTETAATVEEIVRTIKQLNSSIETQAVSVAQSSASVEQMVANIDSYR